MILYFGEWFISGRLGLNILGYCICEFVYLVCFIINMKIFNLRVILVGKIIICFWFLEMICWEIGILIFIVLLDIIWEDYILVFFLLILKIVLFMIKD